MITRLVSYLKKWNSYIHILLIFILAALLCFSFHISSLSLAAVIDIMTNTVIFLLTIRQIYDFYVNRKYTLVFAVSLAAFAITVICSLLTIFSISYYISYVGTLIEMASIVLYCAIYAMALFLSSRNNE